MNEFWKSVFRPWWQPVYRALGRLPHQQLARWQKETDNLYPQREEIQEQIDFYQEQEQSILANGAEAAKLKNKSLQKQQAGKLIRCRREMKKIKAQHAIYDRQIVVLEARIHNATIQQTSKSMRMPSVADLTMEAASAELAVKELSEVSVLAAEIEVGVDDSFVFNQEEKNILAEFEVMAGVLNAEKSEDIQPTEAEAIPTYWPEQPVKE